MAYNVTINNTIPDILCISVKLGVLNVLKALTMHDGNDTHHGLT